MHVISWTDQIAIHQSALMRGIVGIGGQATFVVQEPISHGRIAMGWLVPDLSGVKAVVRPDRSTVDCLLAHEPHNTVHVFGAALKYPWGWHALCRAARMRCRIGLMSESCDPDGWQAPLRWMKHTAIAMTLGQRAQFVLAMGQLGIRWFRRCGYPGHRLFPFGYFVERVCLRKATSSRFFRHSAVFRLAYCGQLIERKRVNLLVHALSRVHIDCMELSIIGDGPRRAELQGIASELGVAGRINWQGSLPNTDARHMMESMDLLALPSRFDGWGAVVNEALMAGIPVVSTDHCGASDLLQEEWLGDVVPRSDVGALTAAIERRAARGPLSVGQRGRIREWSTCITGSVAAQYLLGVLAHVYDERERPIAPWRKTVSDHAKAP